MITKYSSPFVICFLAIALLFSCKKTATDDVTAQPDPPTIPEIPVVPKVENVSATVSGRVLDDMNKPLKGATVTAGAASTTTDINGAFSFNNITLNKNAGFIKVEKTGFFTGSRTFMVTTTSSNIVVIQLIKKSTAGTFTAGTGGNVTVSNGGSINFQAGSIVNAADKSAYTGTVTVSASYINPDSANWRNIMPGALRGVDTTYTEVGLQSFGMMAVELTGGAGEKLQLMNGKPATVTFPIPTSLQTEAAASIPLWFFNDTTGVWKQQGSAAKQGQNYVGQVSHFSFWNCDVPYQIVDFKLAVTGNNGLPVASAQVVISGSVDGRSAWGDGVADSSGKVAGKIPANKTLQLSIYSPCGDLLSKQNIGPFNATTDLGVVNIASYNASPIVLRGTVFNCAGGMVADGEATVYLDNNYYRATITNGSFNIKVPRCKITAGAAKVTALDYGTMQLSSEIRQTVKDTLHDFGVISTCGTVYKRYLIIKFRGQTYTFFPPNDRFTMNYTGGSSLQLITINDNAGTSVTLRWSGSLQSDPTEPFPSKNSINFLNFYTPSNYKTYYAGNSDGMFTIYITENGKENILAPFKYTSGFFSTMVRELDTTPEVFYPLTCSFRSYGDVYPNEQ
ncbi:MAG TPA: hypothetical protein VF008_32630 [Niastella sp.]